MIKLNLDSISELKEQLLGVHEKYYFELKEASNLPKSFWESYSSFCNTFGGWIVLGVKEGNPNNTIQGVGNKEKILVDFWNLLSNPNKVSYRSVDNEDVTICHIDGKDVILIYVNEAPDMMKPVYTKGKLENTWIRTGDGDRLATREQLSALIRNAQPIQDSLIAKGIKLNDLDEHSLSLFKSKVSSRYPKKSIPVNHNLCQLQKKEPRGKLRLHLSRMTTTHSEPEVHHELYTEQQDRASVKIHYDHRRGHRQ